MSVTRQPANSLVSCYQRVLFYSSNVLPSVLFQTKRQCYWHWRNNRTHRMRLSRGQRADHAFRVTFPLLSSPGVQTAKPPVNNSIEFLATFISSASATGSSMWSDDIRLAVHRQIDSITYDDRSCKNKVDVDCCNALPLFVAAIAYSFCKFGRWQTCIKTLLVGPLFWCMILFCKLTVKEDYYII